MDEAFDFLSDLKRHNAVSSYLSSFVNGIRSYTKGTGFLHVGLTQHITATGRFSGRNPNMQNMPRGGTFPVKKVFVSVSYTHLRAHETEADLVCRLLLEKKNP